MRGLLVFILICLVKICLSQERADVNITAHFEYSPLSKVISRLEAQYPITFYYQSSWIDSIYVNIHADQLPFEKFIEDLMEETQLNFHLQGNRVILLPHDISIIEQFPGLKQDPLLADQPDLSIFSIRKEDDGEGQLGPENRTFTIGELGADSTQTVIIEGYIKDYQSGDGLEGASVVIEAIAKGSLTNEIGYYALELPPGNYQLKYQYVGKKSTNRKIELRGSGRLDVELEEEVVSLAEVVISSEKSQIENIQTGISKLNVQELSIIPTVLGEADLLKIALTLPGVSNVGEGSSGFNVRGGATDQNLITLDDAVIYNPVHLFGFFSSFNPDVIKGANLYKSGIPARYGGRSSSIFNVGIRDGNKKRFDLSGGINPITGRITVEGPIGTNSGSYILGLRSTYSDWLLNVLDDPSLKNSTGSFYDLITKVNYWINDKNTIELSGYNSTDRFKLNADTLYQYHNSSASVKWRHQYNSRLFGIVNLNFSNYGYDIESKGSAANAFKLDYAIQQFKLKAEWEYTVGAELKINAGISSIFYELDPGSRTPLGDSSTVLLSELALEKGLENAIYLDSEWNISARFGMAMGLRFSSFSRLGPGTVYRYDASFPKSEGAIIDSSQFSSGQFFKTYAGPEPRIALRYKLNEGLAVKLSYDLSRQYIHMLTNTVSISPTDTWRLSGEHIKPQLAHQLALGLYKSFPNSGWELSLEGYYKTIANVLEYKDGAELLVLSSPETEVIPADLQAYGTELFIKKGIGRWNGWLSYTWSRSLLKDKGVFREEKINNGNRYPSNYDKPHQLVLVSNYKFNRRVNFSLNYTYQSGRPTTLPVSQFNFNGINYAYFSERNQFRIPDYHRLDIALNLEGSHKLNKLVHSSWSLSVFNLLGRENAYSVFARNDDGNIGVYQLSIFARPIPTITYHFKLK